MKREFISGMRLCTPQIKHFFMPTYNNNFIINLADFSATYLKSKKLILTKKPQLGQDEPSVMNNNL